MMEILLIIILPIIVLVTYYWHTKEKQKKQLAEELLRELVQKLVPCTIEYRDNQFYIYNDRTKSFIAQGTTPAEVESNMPKDGNIYVDTGFKVDIVDEVEKQYAQAHGMIQ